MNWDFLWLKFHVQATINYHDHYWLLEFEFWAPKLKIMDQLHKFLIFVNIVFFIGKETLNNVWVWLFYTLKNNLPHLSLATQNILKSEYYFDKISNFVSWKMCLWPQLLEWLHWNNAITLIPVRFCIKWVVQTLYQSPRLRLVQYIGQQKTPTCLHWKSPIWIYWDKL